ncbi:ABC transporter substrate-binding protein [Cryptosporangium aurantiacum]|uniref:NitT/TauT family transport system substrate-binding protein n=1 Tax=Cryptosporangium aurantiacum TaxID=134849 RepID=A0A1M7RME0_9ACTN|nr:ABC transporter substrate-binding protein [Cryptosporangium aurantiacum]SHN47258.1 NitT/TauT family transport system substrate-binding protein [Cryptosporangium aurantiacum]
MSSSRRRRALVAALLAPVLALTAACGSGDTASAGDKPTLKFAYFKGAVAGPESVIAANPELAAKLPVTLKLVPIDSGVAGITQLKGGAFPGISGVGNPPAVAGIGNGTTIDVVFVESLDSAGLVVDDTIKSDADFEGQKIGALIGSTLDFELRGWLKTKGLTDKVEVVGFQSEAAIAAAYKSGRVHAAYVSQGHLLDLKKHGGRVVVTAAEIAKLGYAALGLLVVEHSYSQQHPEVVQALVCQVKAAQNHLTGPDAAKYITPAAGILGVKPADAIAGTKGYPYVPDSEQLGWFKGPDGTVESGRLVENFTLTAEFLVTQDRLKAVPAKADLAARIDPTYVEKAFQPNGCP